MPPTEGAGMKRKIGIWAGQVSFKLLGSKWVPWGSLRYRLVDAVDSWSSQFED